MKAAESPSSVGMTLASPSRAHDQRATRASPLQARIAWCIAMSAMFLITYVGCLHITAARAPVPSVAFAWERYTPFVPAMIIPYWSIDLFFVGSFFLCNRPAELRTHVKRLTLAMGVATACFLLFPLQMANPRPVVDGVWAIGFSPLHALDMPYNLAPSLHIALWTILLALYLRHTRGRLRVALALWFALIYVSTLLTWQHQVFDVITGQALGLAALYLFKERDRSPDPQPAR